MLNVQRERELFRIRMNAKSYRTKSAARSIVDYRPLKLRSFDSARRGEGRGVFVTSNTYNLSQRKRIAHSVRCKMQVALFRRE